MQSRLILTTTSTTTPSTTDFLANDRRGRSVTFKIDNDLDLDQLAGVATLTAAAAARGPYMTQLIVDRAWLRAIKNAARSGERNSRAGGERRLIVAVIVQAIDDLVEGGAAGRSAARYFLGPTYRHHVSALGLPDDMLPAGLTVDALRRALVEWSKPTPTATPRRSGRRQPVAAATPTP